ncbi:MAG: hypothetical protein H0T85_11230 [Geodermatophilaceae bacterium]|nr:hypothetical protein [Geodermatophilaceae bacterium]
MARDVLDVRGVGRSAAHIDGPPEDRRLRIAVVLDGREPVGRVHRDILATAVAHARTAMGERPLPIRVELDVPAEPRRDLR